MASNNRLRRELKDLLGQEEVRRSLSQALLDKAAGGDLKAFELIGRIVDDGGKEQEQASPAVRIELGPGVEELAQ